MKAVSWLKSLPARVQLALIGLAYAFVLAYGVTTEIAREMAAARDPASSSGGMWAFGDELLAWNIFFLFMIPTFFLLCFMRQYDGTYGAFSKVLFGVSLTAPLLVGIFLLGAFAGSNTIKDVAVYRFWRAPFVLMVMGLSRLMARIDVAKRLLTRALLIEGGTFAILFTFFIFG
jgi:hypothetical protein